MDTLSAEAFKWLPQGGAAGAVIFVVYLFLNQQAKMAEMLVAISSKFQTALEESQRRSESQLQGIADKHQEQYGHMQDQVINIVREQIVVNTKMTDAINGLQQTVLEIKHKA